MARRGKKIRRPSIFTPEMEKKVIEHFIYGGSIRGMAANPELPCWETVRKWRCERAEFAARFARAREAGAEYIADLAFDAAMSASDKASVAAAWRKLDHAWWFRAVTCPHLHAPQPQSGGMASLLEEFKRRQKVSEAEKRKTIEHEGSKPAFPR